MQYTELHLHSHYSLLDGLNTPEEYLERAGELGMTHMAITDHGVLSGHREFQKHAKEKGIVPILGCEMYISATDRFDRRAVKKRDDNTQAYNHVIVLAQNENGLNNLNRLSEIAWTEGFYSKPRIDMEVLEEYNEDLIVLSGCLNGLIAKAIANGQTALADSYTREFKAIFGDRFFMELQAHNPHEINSGLVALAEKHDVMPVATSDCHYSRKEDLWLEEAMLILSTNPKPSKDFDFKKSQKMEMLERFNYAFPDRSMSFEKFDLFLHSAADHLSADWTIGQDTVNAAVANTMVVANMIGEYPFHEGLDLLPKPKTDDPDTLLRKKAYTGLKKRKRDSDQAYIDRLEEELQIIQDKGFSSYFLVEANAIDWGKGKGIRFGPGRGSGAGSLVNYALGITEVDPIEHNLLFFRFINPERNDFPDIDTDVEDRRRSEIKDYLKRQHKNVASIATFGTFAGKNSVRDAARVFRVPLGEVNKALKGADWLSNWWEEWEKTEKAKEFIHKYPEVIELAKYLFGRIRSQGMHAGGIVVSKEPIFKYAPMQTAKDNSDPSGARIPLVAYDMNVAAEIGFIKYDFLGLKALSILTETLEMIKERHGKEIVLEDLDFNDKKIYKTLSEGWTKGVFQAEAVPYTNLLIKMGGVKNFDELVASNALVRPGAMNSSAGKAFIDRKEGREMISYPHEDMHWFTKETYGVVIYQEQVMLTMTELAGMSMGDADKVRKIIGKKRDVKEFEAYKSKFIDGASEKVPADIAEQLWHDFEAHAGYSFNKSHAVAYSMVSYWTAWLKEYYPIEFMTAVLRNEGDKDAILDYLMEAKRLKIPVLLPHVNESGLKFEIQNAGGKDAIRMGLSNIKYISDKIGAKIVEHRPYKDYKHLYEIAMTKGSGLSTRVLGSLNAIGGAAFPDNPRTGKERENFYEYLNIPAFETKDVPPKVKAQFRTLDEFSPDDSFVTMAMVRGIKTGEGWARIEVVDETGSAGIFTNEHHQIEAGQMYILLVSKNRVARYMKVDEFDPTSKDNFTRFLMASEFPDVPEGMFKVVAFIPRTTKAGKRMAEIIVCDEHKEMTHVLVFPQMFMPAYTRLREGAVVDIQISETRDGDANFLDKIL